MKKICILFIAIALCCRLNAQTGMTEALTTMGALCGFSVYDSYCVIGSVADAFEDDVYESDYVSQVMDEQITMLTNLIGNLTDLNNSGFITDQADKDYITSIHATMDLLVSEAKALQTYSGDSSSTNADDFQYYRKAAWDKITVLLGIEDTESDE